MSHRDAEYSLIGRTKLDRLERRALSWPGTPPEKKRAILDRMAALAVSPSTPPREAVAAAKVLLQADKLTHDVEKEIPGKIMEQFRSSIDQERIDAEIAALTDEEVHRMLEAGEDDD